MKFFKDKDLKNALNTFLRGSVAAFLKGEEYKPGKAFLQEFEKSGAAKHVSVTTNRMGEPALPAVEKQSVPQ